MTAVFVGLGANLGDPAENLRAAVLRLSDVLDVERVSSLYRSDPVGIVDQPTFLNAVLSLRTALAPTELLGVLLSIERDLGRVRTVRGGPRTLDLDVLLHGSLRVAQPDLVVPHPRMAERRFVLEPLVEIAPDAVHPVLGRTARELLAQLPERPSVERLRVEGWPPVRG